MNTHLQQGPLKGHVTNMIWTQTRRHAGQGVVQFARRPVGNEISLFAIKFFAVRRDFLEEVDVYSNSPLRHFMPRVLHFESNEDSSIRDPFGGIIPPFIVMEKGDSLQERARSGRIDVFTAAQVQSRFRLIASSISILLSKPKLQCITAARFGPYDYWVHLTGQGLQHQVH
jgi:hypothetical protein